MLSVLGFLVILGPLVIVHELGHFFFAKLFGVKAEAFSVGFGPRLYKKQIGETEWRLSAIPMGGYVKLLGEDREGEIPEAERHRALHRAAPWKRFLIFFGGPLFNFLFAILVFMAILAIGEPQIASVASRVVPGSYAEKVGFRSGDRIVAINGKPVRKFEEVMIAINDSPERNVLFQVEHRVGAPQVLSVAPTRQEGFSVYGESMHVGEIDGLLPSARAGIAGISDPASIAAHVGIVTGDEITAINGQPILTWEELESRYAEAAPGAPLKFSYKRKDVAGTASFAKPAVSRDLGTDLGLYSSELFVEKPIADSPAQRAGVLSGDRLVSVGGQSVRSFYELKDNVQRAGEKSGIVHVEWQRSGKIMTADLKATVSSSRDALLKKVTQYTIGVAPMLTLVEPPMIVERIWNPFTLLYKGTERMVLFSWRNLVSIVKMFTGDVSVATLGGPIMIGKIAGESLSRGLVAFLTTMAILSIGLGVLNVLPVPVLDGGHLLLLVIESVRGKALSLRQMALVQQVGLSLLLLLMVIVMKNDIQRLPIFQ